ncbi:hypothetical protein PTI98_009104 [Pleurotus ostreatus]|nr:hypothetical protein PTI98_009104 [Pleurotus ostreatus]
MTCDNVKNRAKKTDHTHTFQTEELFDQSQSEETPLDSDLQTIEDEEGVGSDDSITCEENESDLDNESLETGDIAVEILEREEVSDDGNELDLNELDGSSGSDSGFSDSSNQEC